MSNILFTRRLPSASNLGIEFSSLQPFDALFQHLIETQMPELKKKFSIDLNKGSYPKVDIIECNSDVKLIAELPGRNKDDFKISVENGLLTISGETLNGENNENGVYLVRELKRSGFQRSFKLSDKLDSSKITAKFNDGVLQIFIPKYTTDNTVEKREIKVD